MKKQTLELSTPSFAFRLDTTRGLRAVAWENRLGAETLSLGGGEEFRCTLEAADRRLGITGWRNGGEHGTDYSQPEFDDSKWGNRLSPALHFSGEKCSDGWLRTHVFVPRECVGRPLTLVLGGVGLWDFRRMRVFVNGRLAGVRTVKDRWHAPGELPVAKLVRYGQDNVIAVEVSGQIARTKYLDGLDRQRTRTLAHAFAWPAQFEQYIRVGKAPVAAQWKVVRSKRGRAGNVEVELADRANQLWAVVHYQWKAGGTTLHKTVSITNRSAKPVRILDVDLGQYATRATVSEGEQGFPVYAEEGFFFSLAHPAGWAMGQRGEVTLRQYPGRLLQPGETFSSMEAVFGVAEKDQSREAFLTHVRGRSRRVQRGHDQAYAIFEPYGSWPIEEKEFLSAVETEKILEGSLRQLAAMKQTGGVNFDFFSVDFWADTKGDLERLDPIGFPNGFTPVLRSLRKLGMKPGMWIDSSMRGWTNGHNPVTSPSNIDDPGYPGAHGGFLCRATDPARTIYETAFCHHVRENGVRLLKFDNLQSICYNPNHSHLPGLYSTEAIRDSVIEFLKALDRESRDVFLMLYWGYRSPWWLLHGDTLFEPGLNIEAASPAPNPTLYARDGVTQGLDMAQWYCQDVPWIGKDSLGVWMSEWPWNSRIGRERCPEGMIMDLCRGGLLAQPWYGEKRLSSAQHKQMGELIALLKARPECFAKARFVFGNPWKDEPYGYSCAAGGREFLALNNCTWKDHRFALETAGRDVYRWYPDRTRLTGETRAITLRPFDVVLLELVPNGESPTLERKFRAEKMPVGFAEPSRELELKASSRLEVRGKVPVSERGGTLVLTAERRQKGVSYQTHFPGKELTIQAQVKGRKVKTAPVLGTWTYPSAWQAWRIEVRASAKAEELRAKIIATLPAGVKVTCRGYFIPR